MAQGACPSAAAAASASSAARRVTAANSSLTTAATPRRIDPFGDQASAPSGAASPRRQPAPAVVGALSISSPSMIAVVARWRRRLRVVTAPTSLSRSIGDAQMPKSHSARCGRSRDKGTHPRRYGLQRVSLHDVFDG